jgi:hypothetical protein
LQTKEEREITPRGQSSSSKSPHRRPSFLSKSILSNINPEKIKSSRRSTLQNFMNTLPRIYDHL